jgi:hypothetical protein
MITARFGREARGAVSGHALAELAFNPLELAAFAGLLWELAISPSAVDDPPIFSSTFLRPATLYASSIRCSQSNYSSLRRYGTIVG